MLKIYKAVIYCRLSKEDGDKSESNSIINQRMFCEDFVKTKEDISLVRDAIIDDGVSGVSFEREGFKQLENEVRNGNIDCIIVRDLSRFSRNYIESGRYLERIFPSLGVRFIAINDNYDSINEEESLFMLPFKNLINDTYCRDISTKIRSSLQVKMKNGEFVSAFCPYGYKRDELDKNRLVVDENVSGNVELIFSMFKDSNSIEQIAEYLNKKGILTPLEYKNSVGINLETSFKTKNIAKWEYNTVKRILTNDCYIGTLTQGKRETVNYKVHVIQNKKECDWFKVENSHEAIVSCEDFESVNNLLKRDMRSSSVGDENILSGFLFCGDCGASMVRKIVPSKTKKYTYYVCSLNKKQRACSTHNIALKEIETQVLKTIQRQLGDKFIGLYRKDKKQICNEKQIEIIEKDIEKFNNIKCKIYEDFAEKLISHEEYLQFQLMYNEKIQNKIEILNKIKNEKNTRKVIEQKLSRRLLLAFVDKILIYENHVIEVVFRFNNLVA